MNGVILEEIKSSRGWIYEQIKMNTGEVKLNIQDLLSKQQELETKIFETAGIKEYPFRKSKLALLSELGELANEVQSFKYWKRDKNIDKNKISEEWADCFHIALSLENQLHQIKQSLWVNIDDAMQKIEDIKDLNKYIDDAFEIAYKNVMNEDNILITIICLGRCLDITLEEMEEAYLKKNKVNHRRQEEGY